jgi:hypothetical protein
MREGVFIALPSRKGTLRHQVLMSMSEIELAGIVFCGAKGQTELVAKRRVLIIDLTCHGKVGFNEDCPPEGDGDSAEQSRTDRATKREIGAPDRRGRRRTTAQTSILRFATPGDTTRHREHSALNRVNMPPSYHPAFVYVRAPPFRLSARRSIAARSAATRRRRVATMLRTRRCGPYGFITPLFPRRFPPNHSPHDA